MNADPTPTPMMAQYLEIKGRYPDALLFYRMGDFYELFFSDAESASAALGIALTKRGQHLGVDIPMCGVPVHAHENYLLTLIRKGFRVAVCEQLEDPAEARRRGAKSVVKRDVVRLVTPGTLTEESLLEPRRANFLAAYAEVRGDGAMAWTDISTGEMVVAPCSRPSLGPMLARLSPREVLVADGLDRDLADAFADAGTVLTPCPVSSFDSSAAGARLGRVFGVATLDGFGSFGRAELSALGGIVDYLELTQKGRLPLLRPPAREQPGGVVQIDAATRRNLELTRSLSGSREGSLLAAVDRTVTGGGARLLEARIGSPLTDVAAIRDRQEAVAWFVEDDGLRRAVRAELSRAPDLARALSRLALDRGGPRDLAALRDGLARAAALSRILDREELPDALARARAGLCGHDAVRVELDTALVAEPPHLTRDGGFVAAGVSADLDAARRLRDEGRGVVAGMQAEYARTAGIGSLKIRHNNVLGYFVETPATHAERMLSPPLSETFRHKQTVANAVRFTTPDLAELETRILNAGAEALQLELAIFDRLRRLVLDAAPSVVGAAEALAELDVAAALADLARGENWTRPMVEAGGAFRVTAGRHPVVEAALRREGTSFVANDCDLEGRPLWLITGPNMGGKSTFLRQNALIALLAQIGSFVPAAEACIGVVDRLFSRVGASDDLARGRSTFMVEMVETAAILNQAGPGALVILDEIGRGTATYDGLSLAWAVLEHLHDANRCRALFATHYHELTALAARLAGLRNATVAVREWQGEVVFLHEVREGVADRSYGVQVARLAGLPAAVVERAKVILDALEEGERGVGARAAALVDDLPLFSARPAAPPTPVQVVSPVETRLGEARPDELSPREALALIYELKGLMPS